MSSLREEKLTKSKTTLGPRTMSSNVRRLQETLNATMQDGDRLSFVDVLNQYHMERDVVQFVKKLRKILDTPEKKKLLPLIRKVIPQADVEKFDNCVKGNKPFRTLPLKHRKSETQERDIADLYAKPVKRRPKSRTESGRSSKSENVSESSSRSRKTIKSNSSSALTMKPQDNEVLRIFLGPPVTPDEGFGFSIRGGSEYGLGIYVSLIDKGGNAERQGLIPGDLIMEVNDISFKKILHDEAAKIIKAAKKLELVVCRVGRIPGTFIVHQMYKWVDPHGRGVSPPPQLEQIGNAELGSPGRRSGLMLLKGSDERKINLNVEEGESLGLMIRGGLEFGLGIYISGIDVKSIADEAGLKVGDQILDVNGQSYLDITHAEAVKILKTTKRMMLTIKDVGKLPFGRTTIDRTKWINRNETQKSSLSRSSRLSNSTSTLTGSNSTLTTLTSGFSKGAGSQLMLNSMTQSKWDMVEEQARLHLNEIEQGNLRYYLAEYQKGEITVDGLVLAMFELLNTHAKFSIISEIRNMIRAKDLDKFDTLVVKRETQSSKARPKDMLFPETYSQYSFDSLPKKKTKRRAPQPPKDTLSIKSEPARMARQPSPVSTHRNKDITASDLEPLRLAIEQILDDPESLPDNLPQEEIIAGIPGQRLSPVPGPSHQYSPPRSPRSKSAAKLRSSSSLSDKLNVKYSDHHRSTDDLRLRVSPGGLRHHRSAEDLQFADSNFILADGNLHRSSRASSETLVIADVHHPCKIADSLSPSDDSGVELNGGNRGDINSLYNKVTISAENPVNIDEALSTRSTLERPQRDQSQRQSEVRLSPKPVIKSPQPIRHSLHQSTGSRSPALSDRRRQTSPSPRSTFLSTHTSDESLSSKQRTPSPQLKRLSPQISNDSLSSRSSSSTLEPPPMFQDNIFTELDNALIDQTEEESIIITKAKEKYGDIPLEIITLYKSKPTLGLAIEGGANTRQPLPRVINIQPGGSAYESGGLKSGHVILEVNGQSMIGLEHVSVAKTIAEAFKNKQTDYMELLVTESNISLTQIQS